VSWIFGYGSLIWNPGFEYLESRIARLDDWQLRFWQASEDHRGTPEYPGRVATIVPKRGEQVWGRAYRLLGDRDQIMAYLDHREKGGYQRLALDVLADDDSTLSALCYVGLFEGGSFVGPEKEDTTAVIIKRAVGPSGENIDYLRKLHNSLSEMNRMEPHVDRLLRLVDPFPQSTR
jgi:glutathione-specific gamma-glutamylcyclotransferase